MMLSVYLILGLIGLAVLFAWYLYNSLVASRERVEEAWSDIDVQLKRRADLIPNLVEIVKGYARHERRVFGEVTRARTAVMKAKTPADAEKADNMLTGALKTLFAVAESYPDLKASANFLKLKEELSETENKIAFARRFFNQNVLNYNIKIQSFPNALLAPTLGFKQWEFFEIEETEREEVSVKF